MSECIASGNPQVVASTCHACIHVDVPLESCLVPTITEASGASGGVGKGSSEDLLTLRELLIKAREETTKLQAEKDAVSRHSGFLASSYFLSLWKYHR